MKETRLSGRKKESIIKKTRLSGRKKESIKKARLSRNKRINYEGNIIKWVLLSKNLYILILAKWL